MGHMQNLSSLNLENCTQLSVAGMAAIALTCTRLKTLTVPQVRACVRARTSSASAMLA